MTNTTRGTVVGSTVFFAGTWWGRAKGWLGRPAPVEGEGPAAAALQGHPHDRHAVPDRRGLPRPGRPGGGHVRRAAAVAAHPDAQHGADRRWSCPSGTLARTGTVVGDRLSWEETQ